MDYIRIAVKMALHMCVIAAVWDIWLYNTFFYTNIFSCSASSSQNDWGQIIDKILPFPSSLHLHSPIALHLKQSAKKLTKLFAKIFVKENKMRSLLICTKNTINLSEPQCQFDNAKINFWRL
jgi:hypothetical protein